jgi:hypothetical protein
MSQSDNKKELRRICNLLQELADLSEHASLTGSLEGGSRRAARRYNAIVGHLEERSVIPEGVFQRLDEEEDGYDAVGVESKLLLGYIREEREEGDEEPVIVSVEGKRKKKNKPDLDFIMGLAPFMDRRDVGRMVRAAMKGRQNIDPGIIMGLAPFIDRDEIGKLVREHLPNWFFEGDEAEEEEEAEERKIKLSEDEDAEDPEDEEPSEAQEPHRQRLLQLEGRLAEVSAKLQSVADQLRDADPKDHARMRRLSLELARLGQEQERIARRQERLSHRYENL